MELSPATVEFVVKAINKQMAAGGVDKAPTRKSKNMRVDQVASTCDQGEAGCTADGPDEPDQPQIGSPVSGADSPSDSAVPGDSDDRDTMNDSQPVHDNHNEQAVSSASSSQEGSGTKPMVSVIDMLRKSTVSINSA